MTDIRPIATAPKDGTEILIHNDNGWFVAAWRTPEDHHGAHFPWWWIDNGHGDIMAVRGQNPDVWASLPEMAGV